MSHQSSNQGASSSFVLPLRVLLLLLTVVIFLGILMALVEYRLIPKEIILYKDEGANNGKGITYSVKFFSYQDVFSKEEVIHKDISYLQKRFDKSQQTKTAQSINPQQQSSLSKETTSIDSLSKSENPQQEDSLFYKIRIQYPHGDFSIMDDFFATLQSLEKNQIEELVRVLHYGDSQLEGDRITAYLRNKFQEKFGGCGAGMNGLNNNTNSKLSVTQQNDQQWRIYPIFGKGSAHNTRYFGLLGNFYKFMDAPRQIDSATGQAVPQKPRRAFARFFASQAAHVKDQKTENVKILYRNKQAPFKLSVIQNGEPVLEKEIEKSEHVNLYEVELSKTFKDLRIQFEGHHSPEVYAVTLDCEKGITFDNIPLRGSSGLEFTRFDPGHLARQMELLNVKMIILQFGVNVTPTAEDYSFYENGFYKQLEHLKKAAPNASILVIGTSDRSYNKSGQYISYERLAQLRDAQKRAAFKAGCAFWDLYEAMGGANSMPSWVQENLASPDFTHFTPKGASLVAEMLLEALLNDYESYKTRQPAFLIP